MPVIKASSNKMQSLSFLSGAAWETLHHVQGLVSKHVLNYNNWREIIFLSFQVNNPPCTHHYIHNATISITSHHNHQVVIFCLYHLFSSQLLLRNNIHSLSFFIRCCMKSVTPVCKASLTTSGTGPQLTLIIPVRIAMCPWSWLTSWRPRRGTWSLIVGRVKDEKSQLGITAIFFLAQFCMEKQNSLPF